MVDDLLNNTLIAEVDHKLGQQLHRNSNIINIHAIFLIEVMLAYYYELL